MEEHEMPKKTGRMVKTNRLLVPIPLLTGRPCRNEVISADDIINLQIALNTSMSLEDFLEEV